MKPETVLILKEHPAFRELLAFLTFEAAKLDTLQDLPKTRLEREIAVEGRLQAYAAVSAMLAPLIGAMPTTAGINPKEYAVDVELSTPPVQAAGTPG